MLERVKKGAKTAQRDASPSYQCFNPVMVIGCAFSTFKWAGPAPWYPLSLPPKKVYPRPLWVYSRGLQRAWGLFKQAAISNAKITATPEECSEPDLLSFSLSLIQVCVSFFFVVSLSSFSNWCYWGKKNQIKRKKGLARCGRNWSKEGWLLGWDQLWALSSKAVTPQHRVCTQGEHGTLCRPSLLCNPASCPYAPTGFCNSVHPLLRSPKPSPLHMEDPTGLYHCTWTAMFMPTRSLHSCTCTNIYALTHIFSSKYKQMHKHIVVKSTAQPPHAPKFPSAPTLCCHPTCTLAAPAPTQVQMHLCVCKALHAPSTFCRWRKPDGSPPYPGSTSKGERRVRNSTHSPHRALPQPAAPQPCKEAFQTLPPCKYIFICPLPVQPLDGRSGS